MATIFKRFYEDPDAFINPYDTMEKRIGFPEVCITTFSESIINDFVENHAAKIIGNLYSANGIIPIYEIEYANKKMGLFLSRVGAPACVAGLEEVIALGAKKLIQFGCCGVLDRAAADGKIIIPSSAVRDEGTSYHYFPESEEICADPFSIDIAVQCLENSKNSTPPPEEEYGDLQVTKTVAGAAGDKEKDWHFRVELADTSINGEYGDMFFIDGVAEFTLKHGESKTAAGLPAGTRYMVTEEEANQDNYETSVQGDAGVIPKENTAKAEFLNSKGETPPPEYRYGNLQVTKTVTGTAGDKNRDWHFRVELSDAGINGWYGDMFFTDGVAEITLKHGESKTAVGIPENVTYKVTEREANRDGYTTSSKKDQGTIVNGKDMVVFFVNNKPSATGNPPTGDNSHMGLWIALLAVSLFGAFVSGMSLIERRRTYRRRNMRRR